MRYITRHVDKIIKCTHNIYDIKQFIEIWTSKKSQISWIPADLYLKIWRQISNKSFVPKLIMILLNVIQQISPYGEI